MDDQAFVDIYRAHKHRLVRFAETILGDHHLAEDVANETLMKATTKLRYGFQNPWPWLRSVARNQCLDIIKVRRDQPIADLVELAGGEILKSEVERQELIIAVEHAVADLPAIHQETLRLAYWDGLSYEEIATRQGTSKDSVRDRLHYAKVLLSSKLRSLKESGWIILPRLSGRRVLLKRALRRLVRVAVVSSVSVASVAVVVPQTSFVAEAEEGRGSHVAPGHQVAPSGQISIIGSDSARSLQRGSNSKNSSSRSVGGLSLPENGSTDGPGKTSGHLGPITIHCEPAEVGPAVALICERVP